MNDFLLSAWLIFEPIIAVFTTLIGPLLATWIVVRLVGWMKIDNEARKAEIERQLRDALHQSATNALKFTLTKFKPGTASPVILSEAANYVTTNNPDAVKRFGLNRARLMDIIESKVPDVTATKGGV